MHDSGKKMNWPVSFATLDLYYKVLKLGNASKPQSKKKEFVGSQGMLKMHLCKYNTKGASSSQRRSSDAIVADQLQTSKPRAIEN